MILATNIFSQLVSHQSEDLHILTIFQSKFDSQGITKSNGDEFVSIDFHFNLFISNSSQDCTDAIS